MNYSFILSVVLICYTISYTIYIEVWSFSTSKGCFCKSRREVGVHLSHNGDFNSFKCYDTSTSLAEIGSWLTKTLYCPDTSFGDSQKVCGMLEILRVQGRWMAACRLAYIRAISPSVKYVLSEDGGFPSASYFHELGEHFDAQFSMHVNNIIIAENTITSSEGSYRVDSGAKKQFINVMVNEITNLRDKGIYTWNDDDIKSFVNAAVRNFLTYDLYTAMTEFLSRAKGSFGLQVHTTLEPGVVVLGSKGQPMSVAFDEASPMVLFGSNVDAVAVPVDTKERWLANRIDLDSNGEVMRLGVPKAFIEGGFRYRREPSGIAEESVRKSKSNKRRTAFDSSNWPVDEIKYDFTTNALLSGDFMKTSYSSNGEVLGRTDALLLQSGIEIRAYSLTIHKEASGDDLISRTVMINTSPIPYDPKKDLVAEDLKVTPAVLTAIDRSWRNPKSVECIAGDDLCEKLAKLMKYRVKAQLDTIDLLVSGIEASLWVAEQFASDLRAIFPQLNVDTLSANKILNLGMHETSCVQFSGGDANLERRVTKETCVLLISQSGQTFPTLHAIKRLFQITTERTWILTGCFDSKMESALVDAYSTRGLLYTGNRVFNNYSGNRPAEPSSVAIAATMHTLTHLILHLVKVTRKCYPASRRIHPWELSHHCDTLRRFLLNCIMKKRKSNRGIFDTWNNANITQQKNSNSTYDSVRKLADIRNEYNVGSSDNLIRMTDQCIKDCNSLTSRCVVPSLSNVVGYDKYLREVQSDINKTLVKRGRIWGERILEPWIALILTGGYILITVTLGLPVAAVVSEGIQKTLGTRYPLYYSPVRGQDTDGSYYYIIALIIQLLDAIWYVFLAKVITWLLRLLTGRPLFQRMGKPSLVIVETPCNHQLLEAFVSKLFSLSYGFCSIEVHGASGLDHFLHRFAHRVSRGLLLAVGRPDGRLCCLSKSEQTTLLSVKQASYIRNTCFGESGAGPDIVTLGHNGYKPSNLPSSRHITIPSEFRDKFIDEILFEKVAASVQLMSNHIDRCLAFAAKSQFGRRILGTHHINTRVTESYDTSSKFRKWKEDRSDDIINSDPSDRLAFSSRLDETVVDILGNQLIVQNFYETRIAALERYISFCVMFHAMAKVSSTPWLCSGWDIGRSQSNMRIATTACPIDTVFEEVDEMTLSMMKRCRQVSHHLRGYRYKF